MSIRNLMLSFVMLLFLSACATLTEDIQVETETAPGVNLADYKSFAWVASAEIVNDPYGNWEPTDFDADAEIKFLLLKELRDKGLEETTRNPDLLLVFAAGVDMQNLEFVEDSKTKLSSLEEVPKGALLVIMVDFSDNPATVTDLAATFDNLIFAPQVVGRGSVRDYFADASYGNVDVALEEEI